jgi:hypothetical protein
MRQSPKDLLRDHRDDEDAVLAWIADASILELQELIRLAGKTAFTMGYVFPAQRAITIRLGDQAAKQSERLEKQMVELVGIAAEQKRLAVKLDGQTEMIISLTRRLNRLTFWLVALTIALVGFEVLHFVESRQVAPSIAQFPQQTNQNSQQQGNGNAKP